MEREATPEAYHSVDAAYRAGKLTQEQWSAYVLLWHYGPLTKTELNQHGLSHLGSVEKPPWGAHLKKLGIMGIARNIKGAKWDVTNATTVLDIPKKPSGKKYAKGVEDITLAITRSQAENVSSPEAEAILRWLQSKV